MFFNPTIHQCIAHAYVVANRFSLRSKHRNIANAANIEHHGKLIWACKNGFVKGRHQRCTLTSHRHIFTAKISDGSNPRTSGDQIHIANLHRKWEVTLWSVPNRLSVATNGGNLACLKLIFHQEIIHTIGIQHA